MSLLAAMFINKYKDVWKNLDAYRRFNIIRLKNSVLYDRYLGGVTITFFPINVMILPFIVPLVMLRSKRASDFLLKMQYLFMVIMYALIAGLIIVPTTPILYLKLQLNSFYIFFTKKRQDYRGQNIV